MRPAVADAAGEGDGGGGEELLDAVAVEVGEAARQAQVHQRDVVVQGPQDVPCEMSRTICNLSSIISRVVNDQGYDHISELKNLG